MFDTAGWLVHVPWFPGGGGWGVKFSRGDGSCSSSSGGGGSLSLSSSRGHVLQVLQRGGVMFSKLFFPFEPSDGRGDIAPIMSLHCFLFQKLQLMKKSSSTPNLYRLNSSYTASCPNLSAVAQVGVPAGSGPEAPVSPGYRWGQRPSPSPPRPHHPSTPTSPQGAAGISSLLEVQHTQGTPYYPAHSGMGSHTIPHSPPGGTTSPVHGGPYHFSPGSSPIGSPLMSPTSPTANRNLQSPRSSLPPGA